LVCDMPERKSFFQPMLRSRAEAPRKCRLDNPVKTKK
jgi:hypothetical protein